MIEVLKLALEALELVSTEFVCNGAHHAKKDRHELGEPCPIVERYEEAITSLRQAISELESQEPVAGHIGWLVRNSQGKLDLLTELQIDSSLEKYERLHKLYTHPPQRTWVGLTDEEICMFSMWLDDKPDAVVFTAIEAKLKQKNTN